MRDLDKLDHFPKLDKLSRIICEKTQNTDPLFFRILVAYYFTKIASTMRTNIRTLDRGVIPVNMYAINTGNSGLGKGYSTNIIEEQVIDKFRDRFMEETFPYLVEQELPKLAVKRANRKGTDPDEELVKVEKEFNALGKLPFSFDSGTSPAVKQMRHILLMSGAGSVNLEMDEFSNNLLGNTEVLNVFLELYDQGKVKQKLTKNTNDSVRNEEIYGKTPTNMMLFGTPLKLLDGGKVEEEFIGMLGTGYARRCFFGHSVPSKSVAKLSAEKVFEMMTDTSSNDWIKSLSRSIGNLADIINFNKVLTISKDVSILLIKYKQRCENLAEDYPDHKEVFKAELSHRYYKVLKLAGTFAFIDDNHEITKEYIYNAIKLAEESGKAFNTILKRERNYVKLANYIAEADTELTQADLIEDLPFYKGTETVKREMMTLATAYGYKNNIIIKKSYLDGIEFFEGESLKETDLSKIKISYSTELADNYKNEEVDFNQLHKLTQSNGFHWTVHHMRDK